MKKETAGKKNLLWLWIVIGVLVVAAIATGVVLFMTNNDEPEEVVAQDETPKSALYWNVEPMLDPEAYMSNREPAEDGLYYVKFSVRGELKEIPVADKKLVDRIDRMELMGLKMDNDGVVVDIYEPDQVAVKISDKTYVQNVNGNQLLTNSAVTLNGMQKKYTFNDNTVVVNVSNRAEVVGAPDDMLDLDQVIIYGSDENTPTDVFIVSRMRDSKVYWRVDERMYNATLKMSSRPRAEDGYFYIKFAADGEVVTVRTSLQDVINALDGYTLNAACCGLEFNEKGDVVDCFSGAYAARGQYLANNYDITELSEDGKTFTATRVMFGTELGKTYKGVIGPDTKVYNVNSTAEMKGEETQLQMNDRVFIVADAMGNAKVIFVVNRMVEGPLYYNVSRNYSSGLKMSQRTPDADGWYNIKLAANGREVTYRTRDFNIVNQLDAVGMAIFGLKVENGIILKVYDAVCVTGNYSFAANNFVDSVDGIVLSTSNTAGTAANGVMSENCEVYDVSGFGKFRGVSTTVREGDRVICYQNATGEITHIYIIARHEAGSVLYWNVNRYYANGQSDREGRKTGDQPLLDEDGYYHFRVIKVGGTDVTWIKTKDKAVADRMDSYGTPTAFSVYVNKAGVVSSAYPVSGASGGYQTLNYLHVDSQIDDESWGIKSYRTGATATLTWNENMRVYDYSADTVVKGEKGPEGAVIKGSATSIRVGDKISCIAGRDGKVHTVFVIERETYGAQLAVRKSGNANKANEDGYYVFELLINGQVKTLKTKDELLAKKITGYGYAFAVKYNGEIITGVYTATACPDVYEMASGAYYDVVNISGGMLNLKRNRVGQTDTGKETSVKIASNYKAYVIDPGSPNFGKSVSLHKGDRVYCYTNYNAEISYVFVAYECTREGGNMGYCEHCGKTVHWESLMAGYSPAADCVPEVAHFYVPYDRTSTSGYTLGNATQQTEGKSTEIVLDLNGKVLTRGGTLNEADGKSYASGGLVTAGYGNTVIITDYSKADSGKIVTAADTVYSGAGSLLHVQSGSKLIIEEGLFDGSLGSANYTGANGGTISVGGELVVNGGTIKGRASNGNGSAIGAWGGTSITINGGVITGNTMTEGVPGATGFGGVIATNGNLTITGGTISGGSAVKGDNIYVGNAKAEVVISGGNIDGGIEIAAAKSVTLSGKPVIKAGTNYGLKCGAVKLDVSGLKTGAKVYVDASGVFTKDLASASAAQALINNGALKAGAEGMMLVVDGKAVSSVSDGKLRTWTDATKLPEMGRWKLGVDVTLTARTEISNELYIDLNGHDITRTVKEDATTGCQVFRVSTGKLTIDDTSASHGTVSVAYAEGQAINDYSAVIHVTDQGEMILEGGIIDGSNVDNLYVNATNGTISVGGKLTVNGGVIKGVKRGSSNGGAIGGWADTEIVVNGGTIYAGGSFLNAKDVQVVNGAAIATTGSLTINGGKIVGPGKDSTAEQRARSGGLIYANGDSLYILGGELVDGFGTGYGFNVYYERNYLAPADENGKRASITGGGDVIIGGDAYINGGVTIRSSKADVPVKLTVKDNAVIDSTGAVAATNVRLYNGELYLNDDTTAITAAPENANYDISLVYTCQNVPTGFNVGNVTKYEHAYGDDHICDHCGYDKNTPQPWTDKAKLPTSGNYYLDVDVETSATTTMSGDLYLDLKGHTITHKALVSMIQTGANKLTVTDTTTEADGKITTVTLNGEAKGLIYVQANGELVLEAGTIDGSNITNTYTGAASGAITVGNGKINGVAAYGKAVINGGTVKGWKSSGMGSAIGMMNLTTLEIHGGEIIGNTVIEGVSGAGYGGTIMANGHLTITGGKIHGGTAAVGGDNIFVNNASANVVITGGEIDGGVTLNAYANVNITGGKINEGANYGLKIPAGKKIDLTGLTGGEIYVDATNVFTTNFATADAATAAMALLKSGDAGKKLALDGNAIKMVSLLEISLDKTSVELDVGADTTITATKSPAEATITWTSPDEAVATVDATGKVTAVAPGTATITATASYNGIEVTATCTVTVKAPVVQDPIEEQDWVEWTKADELPTEGKYKLMTGITVSASASLTGELWLDLNGCTISSSAAVYNTNGNKLVIDDLSGKTGDELGTIKTTATSANASGSVIQVGAVANGAAGELILNNGIIDGTTVTNTKANATTGTVAVTNATNSCSTFTMNGGIIKGQKSSVMTSGVGGSALALHNGTTFVMNGGELRAHSAGDFSANVCCTGTCICAGTATITINGGTLVAGRAQNHGAAIYTKGNLTMNGGTIIGGQSQNSGAIYSEGDQVTILGGLIYGGKTVANPGNGGAVDKYKGTVTIGGNAFIGGGVNIRSSAKLILKDAPVIDTSFGLQQRFDIRVNGGSIHLNDASSAAIQSANGYYSLTYGTDGKVNGVKAFAAVTYTESATLPTSGAVKLTGPVTLTEALVTTGNLYIDLNGQTVTMTGGNFAIQAKHNVVITDSSAEKTGKIVNTNTSFTASASVLKVENGKKVVLAGGTLDGSAVTNGFASGYSGTVTVGNDASFIMLGGEVKGQCMASTGSTGKGGSCIGGWGNSNVIIHGGTLTAKNKGTSFPGNSVAAQGSCIATGGNVEIHGGELYGTMATNHGGNIYCTGNLTITGGLISGGYSNNSGLINCSGASFTITGGTLVGGTAHSSSGLGGASIDYANNGGVLTIGGNAKIAGGVSIRGGAKLVLKDKAVIDMNMAGQTQKKFNIQIKSGACSIWLNEATGTALASASSGKWDVTYDNAGNITGIEAK